MTGAVVWASLAGTALAWEAIARLSGGASRGGYPTLADVLVQVNRVTVTRWFLIGLWGLLGWHVYIGFP
ncbi:MAG: hypothetical protein ACRD1G_20545 [Acidimicrobiales bacterium]